MDRENCCLMMEQCAFSTIVTVTLADQEVLWVGIKL